MTSLTPRQRDVAQLVAQGLNYRQIGEALDMAPDTARVHVHAIAQRIPDSTLPAYKRVMVWMLTPR